MSRQNVSAELAAKYGLPGLLAINENRDRAQVELDLPQRKDRLKASVVPGLEALVFGYLVRLHERHPSSKREHTVVASDEYMVAWLHIDDLDHFMTSLVALFVGASFEEVATAARRQPDQSVSPAPRGD